MGLEVIGAAVAWAPDGPAPELLDLAPALALMFGEDASSSSGSAKKAKA